MSFTPCVYPLLPITASFIGGFNTSGSKHSGLVLSLLYVLGMALTYTALGVIAALTGQVFGQIQSHPITYIIVANIIIFFSLAMFDVIQLPQIALMKKSQKQSRGLLSVLIFGMASGLMIGPCTAPALGTVLLYAGTKANLWHAGSLLFVFAYGLGTSLIIVGTFSGVLSRLPKSGVWMARIKWGCAMILLCVAQYFLIKAGGLM